MASPLVPRAAAQQLREAVADFRIVIVNGPRQAGKTTLLELFQAEHGGSYRSFDEAEHLRAALADPVSYVRQGEQPLIIDEVQRGGNDVILAIERVVDQHRNPGQFVLSGSTRFLTVPTLSESLAGRAVFVDLWQFCMAERARSDYTFIDKAFSALPEFLGEFSSWDRAQYLELICAGSYPEALRASTAESRRKWFNGYVRTIISRDITEFVEVQHVDALRRLLAMISARSGSTFVQSDLARSLRVSHDTVRVYTSYLETVFLAATVLPWSTNLTSRLVKTPKVYITDSGLAAHLIQAAPQALANPGHPALGGLTETFVFTELLKLRSLTRRRF